MVVSPEGSGWIALTNSAAAPSWGKQKHLPHATELSLVINARVAAAPDTLRDILEDSLTRVASQRGMDAKVIDLESFSPPPPARNSFTASDLRI